MAKVHSLGATITHSMLDDQKALMHVQPKDANGNNINLDPAQPVPSYASDNTALGTVDASVDPTGLSAMIVGVKGQAGSFNVTATYMNADGSVATGIVNETTTLDPNELKVADLAVTVDAAIAQ